MKDLPISINISAVQMTSKPASSSANATATQSASSKPANADDNSSAQGTKSFGDELARQVNDSSPSEKPSETPVKDAASSGAVAGKAEKEASSLPEAAVVLPADILATLLAAQQTQAGVVPQEAAPLQQVISSQLAATLPDTALSALAGKSDKLASLVENAARLQPGQAGLSQVEDKSQAKSALPATNIDLPVAADTAGSKQDATNVLKVAEKNGEGQPVMSAAKDKTNFTDVLNDAGKAELAAGLSGESVRNRKTADLSTTAQQSGNSAISAASAHTQAPAMLAGAQSSHIAINTPVGQAGWGNEFNQKITWIATQRNQSAELHLNPPQLGPLDVVLKVSGDQAVALFASPHAAVREAIEQALPKLRDMLADNGIMLGNATVSDQSAKKDQDDLSRTQQGKGNTSGLETEVTAVHSLGGRVSAISRHNGMVDTFA